MTSQTIEAVHAAYFESEAARSVVSPGDGGYLSAVNRISDDNGASWRVWLASADQMTKDAVARAYSARNAAAPNNDRPVKAKAAYEAVMAGGGSRNAAVKEARKIWGDFKPGKAA